MKTEVEHSEGEEGEGREGVRESEREGAGGERGGRERERERERDRQTDRQTGRQASRQTGTERQRPTDRQISDREDGDKEAEMTLKHAQKKRSSKARHFKTASKGKRKFTHIDEISGCICAQANSPSSPSSSFPS